MAREVMRRRASDNPYFHRDFHVTLNQGLIYLQERFGPAAVRDYLRQLGRTFYSPLSESLRRGGLGAIRQYLERSTPKRTPNTRSGPERTTWK